MLASYMLGRQVLQWPAVCLHIVSDWLFVSALHLQPHCTRLSGFAGMADTELTMQIEVG